MCSFVFGSVVFILWAYVVHIAREKYDLIGILVGFFLGPFVIAIILMFAMNMLGIKCSGSGGSDCYTAYDRMGGHTVCD